MSLSTKQLADLRHDLTSLATISYDHLADELLDHYAMLTEENMATGQSFHEAGTAAFHAMGNGIGIQQIQERYERVTRHQIRGRHIAIEQSYLMWPTVLRTLLVGVIMAYLILAVLPPHFAKLLPGVLVLSPAFVLLIAGVSYFWQRDSRKRLVWKFIKSQINAPTMYITLIFILSSTGDGTLSSFIRVGFAILSTVGNLFLTVSLAQLTRETFYYKPIFQR